MPNIWLKLPVSSHQKNENDVLNPAGRCVSICAESITCTKLSYQMIRAR